MSKLVIGHRNTIVGVTDVRGRQSKVIEGMDARMSNSCTQTFNLLISGMFLGLELVKDYFRDSRDCVADSQ